MLYKEETVAVYTRASDIIINNPLSSSGLSPAIRFNEERAVVGPDGVPVSMSGLVGVCGMDLTPDNGNNTFPLRNPETDEVIGESSYLDVYVLLYSLYAHAAELRDNAEPDEAIPLPEGVTSVLDMEDTP